MSGMWNLSQCACSHTHKWSQLFPRCDIIPACRALGRDLIRFPLCPQKKTLNFLQSCRFSESSNNNKNPSTSSDQGLVLSQDDIIDNVEAFIAAADILKERGASKVYIMATHGLLSADAPTLLEASAVDEVKKHTALVGRQAPRCCQTAADPSVVLLPQVVVTNTVPHDTQKRQCSKIKTVDVSMILAEAVRRIHHGESMAHLFRHVTVND